MELQQGAELGDYVLQEPLGKGEYSTVWRAVHKRTGIEVALKVNQEGDPLQLRRFAKEAEVLQSLNHSNIVPFRGYDVQGDVLYLAMRYIKGVTLQTLINNRRRANPNGPIMPLPEVERFVKPLVSALEYLHQRGIIHRDLKPANILIEEGTNQVIITDFGLVKTTFGTQGTVGTAGGFDFTGTILYTTPEQLSNGFQISPATDQYSLAIIAYELLTGNPPFTSPDNNPFIIMGMHLNNLPTPPSYVNRSLPPGLDNVFKRALEKDPGRRFPSVTEFYRAFLIESGLTNMAGVEKSVFFPVDVRPEARPQVPGQGAGAGPGPGIGPTPGYFPGQQAPVAGPGPVQTQGAAPGRPPMVLPSYVAQSGQPAVPVRTRSKVNGLLLGVVLGILALAIILAVLVVVYLNR